MNFKNTSTHYNTISIALHWLMFILIVAVFGSIELRELFDKGTDTREAFKMWHFMLGLSVLALVSVRLVARVVGGSIPAIQPEPAKWQNTLAKLVQLALYVFMFAMPIAGWLILSMAGKPVPFFGLELPPLTSENKELAKTIEEIHETAGEVGYYLIGLHAAAALFHHYILADNTFKRMLFSKK
ncbi:cytochrome b [Pseudoalteromonas sp. JBTF-M23]|uniref:Cytochrome b n=1 Tax=Pseudoalteromonas caenipelagi TaxID=2726988 RepID=A0A849VI63_9GAMM|nr:cytochrome b [Pseudoalteromonas caenipelagi]NOU51421.1 cytochrome b [Pseudoalteromonas caenipelagi]